MLATLMISLLYFAVGTVVLTSGVFTLQNNTKAPINRVFFALTVSVTIWSAGIGFTLVSPNASACEICWRFSAFGWCTVYALLLHFVLIITGKISLIKKKIYYSLLYLPAIIILLVNIIPTRLNSAPFDFHHTRFGWIAVGKNNIWAIIFYIYYIGYSLTVLFLLYLWGRDSQDDAVKKKSRYMILSIVAAFLIGTITDVILNHVFDDFPQMAPIILLIPTLVTFHILQKDSFSITEGIDKKTSYVVLYLIVLLYILLSAFLTFASTYEIGFNQIEFDNTVINGMVIQLQMFLSIYLVLAQNMPGYIAAVMVNFIGMVSAVAFMISYRTHRTLPAIMSYLGVLLIISLIKNYKSKNVAYIKKINTQALKEEFYYNVFSQAPIGIAIFRDSATSNDDVLKEISINPAYEKILGRTKEELENINWMEMTHPDDLPADLELYERFKNGEMDYYTMEKRYIRPDGSVVWVDMIIARFEGLSRNPDDHVCILTDITERKQIEEVLKYNSEHEMATGLYNRFLLEKSLTEDAFLLYEDKRALIGINLTAIHTLNTRYGYHFSRNLLKNIADSLKEFCNERFTLYHIYDYVFVFYVKGYKNDKELTGFCNEISDTLKSYLYIHGIGVGIGILQLEDSADYDVNELLQMLINTSEMAIRDSSNNIKVLFHTNDLDERIARENDISQELTEIAEGIKMERLYLHFQPIYDIKTNKICGFEALARLQSDKYGRVSPVEFIPIAEKTGMISPLGEFIIFQALQFLQKLRENGYDNLSVSINISTIQILEAGFADKLMGMIKAMDINPANVGVELTESVFATERSDINEVLNVLRANGIRVLIDDFGSGYSSLAREQELNVDFLKIDKRFIDRLIVLNPEESITSDIISMSHKLGHCVIAEGVEYEKQLEYLREFGCDRIQGYIISRPVDEESALKLLDRQKA